ncbi:hypothetical protein BGW80DRAFT_1556170 [Lactifluus volemus]|nr:hypothetical protein BGW80DRAFT_1556170 [Lactifluus volemus]
MWSPSDSNDSSSTELDPPMSDWFCSIPHTMDTLSYSIKFQQDMLASLIRFLREKMAQQREILLRVKQEREELKSLRKTAEELRAENEQLRLYAGLHVNGSNGAANFSGKRQRTDAYSADGRNPSSPRSVITPLGPNRLTLPAGHQPPVLSEGTSNTTNVQDSLRPLSSRLRQFAFDPSHIPQGQPIASKPQQGTSHQQQLRTMMPPPPPSRDKAKGAYPSGVFSHARGQLPLGDGSLAQPRLPPDSTFGTTMAHRTVPVAPKRFTPRASSSYTPSGANSRFVPQTPDSRRFVPAAAVAGSRVHSRAGYPNPPLHDGQRTPFFPGPGLG